MRALVFFGFLICFVPCILVHPYIGVLLYPWISFMRPHRLVWGFPPAIPLAMITTLIAWFLSKEPKRLPFDATVWLILAFMTDISITTFLSLSPAAAFDAWEQVTKELLFVLMTIAMTTNRIRFHALL